MLKSSHFHLHLQYQLGKHIGRHCWDQEQSRLKHTLLLQPRLEHTTRRGQVMATPWLSILGAKFYWTWRERGISHRLALLILIWNIRKRSRIKCRYWGGRKFDLLICRQITDLLVGMYTPRYDRLEEVRSESMPETIGKNGLTHWNVINLLLKMAREFLPPIQWQE